jgi:hypothetical protein
MLKFRAILAVLSLFNQNIIAKLPSHPPGLRERGLTLILLMWRIWRAPYNDGNWQDGFNSAFKGLN